MTLTITVHRGTEQIGGSCIEIAAPNGERLILDAGKPLDAPRDAKDLLPSTLDKVGEASVIFSHPHMDHWGLINELPEHWSIWTGRKSAELIKLTVELFGDRFDRRVETWDSRSGSFSIGNFTIVPYLTDHSAFDAYMLVIEGWGRRILYTGDFRAHGRKSSLMKAMINRPPPEIDALLMEGTNLRSAKPMISEKELEEQFVKLARATKGQVYVQWSAQNLDRTVTLYRAAVRSGRKLVVDLYCADVLERVTDGTGVPRPSADFPALEVVITPSGQRMYERQGRVDFVTRMARSGKGTSRRRLSEGRSIIMLRDSMVPDFEKGGLHFSRDDAYVFSNWSGYLDPDDDRTAWARAVSAGATTSKLHTSGHASPAALSKFAKAISPKTPIPVHGVEWDQPNIDLPPITRLGDGEVWHLP